MSENNSSHWQEIDTIKSLGGLVDIHQAAPNQRIYRGVKNKDYDLLPKIGRHKDSYTLRHEKELLARFIRQSQPHLTYVPQSDLEWMILAQQVCLRDC